MRISDAPEIAELLRRLSAALLGGEPTAPPVVRRSNAWGELVLRAYRLGASCNDDSPAQVALTIERREPSSLGLWRRVEALALSRREKEVCLLLVQGHDAAHAAGAMGVSEHTLVSHRRSLYAKLGVDNRWALIERLRAE